MDNLESMIFRWARARKRGPSPESIPVYPLGATLPRVIHQTYPTKSLPSALREIVDRNRRANPDWEYRFYDDDDVCAFIGATYGETVVRSYLRINPTYGPAKADLFRYLLIYKCGGVYLDIKSTLTRPLDDVIRPNDKYLLSRWRNRPGEEFAGWGVHKETPLASGGEFQQWHIVAAPGHPFLRAVITNVLTNITNYNQLTSGTGQVGVVRLTGPIAYTLAILPILNQHEHRFVDAQSDLGFQYSAIKGSGHSGHRSLFKTHYTELTSPVVLPTLLDRVLTLAVRVARRF